MFAFCADPRSLEGAAWFACFLTTGTHLMMYAAFGTVLLLLALAAPSAMALGMAGALAARSRILPVALVGRGYIAMVRGVPDVVFFLFVPIAVDQGIEYLRHLWLCPDWTEPVRRGADFVVCRAARLPQSDAPQRVHEAYAFLLALLAFALVFGAFAANTLKGAMEAVPRAQVETALAFGMTDAQAFRRVILPQMWVHALPGLTNLWMILVKTTPLLFLLGIRDIVFWARELGAAKTEVFAFPHPDWRAYYFGALLVFYLALTWVSDRVFAGLSDRLSRGQATAAGERMRRGRA